MKALVADDSEFMRIVLSSYLGGVGISEVDTAQDGFEAVVKGKFGNYDVILLDWNMPGMPGIQVLRELRGSAVTTPIVMVTTEASGQTVSEALAAGASEYLVKPLQKEAFVSRIQRLLSTERPHTP